MQFSILASESVAFTHMDTRIQIYKNKSYKKRNVSANNLNCLLNPQGSMEFHAPTLIYDRMVLGPIIVICNYNYS